MHGGDTAQRAERDWAQSAPTAHFPCVGFYLPTCWLLEGELGGSRRLQDVGQPGGGKV